SLLFFWKYRGAVLAQEDAKDRRSRSRSQIEAPSSRAGLWFALSGAFYAVAIYAKETAIVFPVVIFLLAFVFPYVPGPKSSEEPACFASRSRYALIQSTLFLAVAAIYMLMRLNALEGKLTASTQHLRWTAVVLLWPSMIWFYAKTIFWPVRSYAFANGDVVEH